MCWARLYKNVFIGDAYLYSEEITCFINERSGKLTSKEILQVINVNSSPQLDHIICENGHYKMWDNIGTYFTFCKRDQK